MICKLTDKDGKTRNNTQWGPGVSHKATRLGTALCTNQVIHYCEDEYLAVFANPTHSSFNPKNMRLWEFAPKIKVAGDAMKSACKEGTTIKEVPIPNLTVEQCV